MAHDHTEHGHHHHHHHHGTPGRRLSRAFVAGIWLNLLFVVIEAGAGFWNGSLALLTDAGHNLGDVGSLILALLGFRLARVRATGRFSYGYRKATVLASLTNALILLVIVVLLGYEAVMRFFHPQAIPGLQVAAVAGAGILINALSAWLFHRDQQHDINARGAYLHLLADAAVSAAVVLAGILIYFTGWQWFDPAISLAVLAAVLWSTWGLLRDSVRLSLDGVPPAIRPETIREAALKIEGVRDIHHIHVWPLSTTETAMTAHLVLAGNSGPAECQAIKRKLRHALEHLNVQHVTLETESEGEDCGGRDCS